MFMYSVCGGEDCKCEVLREIIEEENTKALHCYVDLHTFHFTELLWCTPYKNSGAGRKHVRTAFFTKQIVTLFVKQT